MAADVAPGLLRAEAADPLAGREPIALTRGSPAPAEAPSLAASASRAGRATTPRSGRCSSRRRRRRRRVGLEPPQGGGARRRHPRQRPRHARGPRGAGVRRARRPERDRRRRPGRPGRRPPAGGRTAWSPPTRPYGERLGDRAGAEAVCRLLGERLRAAFPRLARRRARRRPATRPRPSACRPSRDTGAPQRRSRLHAELLRLTSTRRAARRRAAPAPQRRSSRPGRRTGPAEAAASSDAAHRRPRRRIGAADTQQSLHRPEQLANRLRRNLRHIGRTMRRQGVTCYRLYDADLPEYSLAVDVYEHRLHVQEYAPPPEIDPARAAAHLDEAVAVIADVLKVARGDIVVKQRRRQRGAAQYERRAGRRRPPARHRGRARLPRRPREVPRHRPLSRPARDPSPHPDARRRPPLPQPLRLHRHGDGVRHRRRRRRDDHRRPLGDLPRLGAAQPAPRTASTRRRPRAGRHRGPSRVAAPRAAVSPRGPRRTASSRPTASRGSPRPRGSTT